MPSEELTQFPLEEEYRKNTGITPEDIAGLRRWLNTQPHLPSNHITDLDLILIFHSCDRSTGVTKQVLDLHFTLRTLFTTFFKDRQFDARIRKTLDTILVAPLQMRTKEGYAIFYTRFLDPDYKKFSLGDSMRTVFMILDLWQYKEGTWPGFILLIDFDNMTLGHLSRMEVQYVQQFLYYMQETMTVKLKGFYFMNAPSFMDKFLMLIKPFMKKQLMDMLRVYETGNKALEAAVPLEALPSDSGGQYKSCQECKEDTLKMLQSGKAYLRNERLKRVTESLRPGKPKTISDIFSGVEGSFKKLDID